MVDTVAGGCRRGICDGLHTHGLESVCYQIGSIRTITHMARPMNTSLPMQCCPICGGKNVRWTTKILKPEVRHHVFFFSGVEWRQPTVSIYPIHLSATYVPAYLDPNRHTHIYIYIYTVAHTHTHTQLLRTIIVNSDVECVLRAKTHSNYT